MALTKALFETPRFSLWQRGGHHLHLFLDSLDECLLRIDAMASMLAEQLKNFPTERLSLRIACRTADWPSTLEEALRKLWGEQNVAVYELAPLRRVDVAIAATANGLDADSFLKEIHRIDVVPLAIKPVTLELLLNLYKRDKQLPKTQRELYAQGCRLLCEESNPHRRESGRTGILDADKRYAIAGRINECDGRNVRRSRFAKVNWLLSRISER